MRKSITLTIAFLLASMSSILMANPLQNKNNATTVSRAYALRVYDDSWGKNNSQTELVSFDVDNPNEMTVEQKFENKLARAATYVDGTYYMLESDDGYVAYRFSSYDVNTKEYKVIKEYKTSDLENALMIQCMTYDPTTKKIFLYAFDILNSTGGEEEGGELDIPFELLTIDPATGKATVVGENTMQQILTLAVSADGYMYGIDTNGTLWGINKTNGSLLYEEGYAPVQPKSLQSMAFDTKNNLLYWAGFTTTSIGSGSGFFGKFSFSEDEGWMYSNLSNLNSNSELVGLYIDSDPAPKGSPSAVSNLALKAADNGKLQATLTWTNPQFTTGGEPLSGTHTVKVYRDDQLLATVDNQTAGSNGSVVITETTSGIKGYTVGVSNAYGDGRTAYVEGFVGRDTPGDIVNLKLTKDADNQLSVSWDAPATGMHGGWYDTSTLKYNVVRLPDNAELATGITDKKYTDANIEKMGGYSYSVTATNVDGNGATVESGQEFAGNPIEMPFSCNFSTSELVRLWKVYDADKDGQTWYSAKNNVESFMKYFPDQELSPDLKSNDWLISAPMRFEAGKTYTLQYWERTQGQLFPVNYNITIGKGTTPEAQTTILSNERNIVNQSMEQKTVVITVPETGVYSIGFQVLNRVSFHLKDVVIEQRNAVELAAEAFSGSNAPVVGEASDYTVKVKNNGYEQQSNFEVQLLDSDDNVLASNSTGVVEPFESKDIVVAWTPQAEGKFKIHARVVADGDADATNNDTEEKTVTVLANGSWVDVAINHQSENSMSPFNVMKKYSIAQTIYDSDSLNCGNVIIKGLMFYYKATTENNDFPVEIYLANTDKENFNDMEAVPENEFTLVYDGNLAIPVDQTTTMVLFDKPFAYDGQKNLAMMTRGNAGSLLKGIYFMSQYISADKDKHMWYDFSATERVPFPSNVLRTTKDRASVSFFTTKQTDGINSVNATEYDIDVKMVGNILTVNGEYDNMRIYSVAGKLVGENAHHDNYINMSKYQTGVYLLEFVKGNAKTVKRVIVK